MRSNLDWLCLAQVNLAPVKLKKFIQTKRGFSSSLFDFKVWTNVLYVTYWELPLLDYEFRNMSIIHGWGKLTDTRETKIVHHTRVLATVATFLGPHCASLIIDEY